MAGQSEAPARLVVGVVQMCSTDDREHNFSVAARLVAEANARGVDLCCFPEGFHFIGGGETGLSSGQIAESLEASASLEKYAALAKEHGVMLSLGGFQERPSGAVSGAERGKVCNAHIIVSPEGGLLGVYRKMHLFDYADLVESNFTSAGQEPRAVALPGKFRGWMAGLTTCYDLRFPSLYQHLRTKENCNLLLVPSAFTRRTGEAHWHVLLRARAIETQSFVLAAAQSGSHNGKRESYGHAMIIDPWGKILAEATDTDDSGGDGAQLIVAELDHSLLTQIRKSMPIAEHKRFSVVQKF